MTEAAKVFNDDIREKKSIKNSASKTNRTGKGPVRFPSDYLSKKEKEQLNGECTTWKYSDFPDRKAFKKMPDDIKIGYINWILNVYNVGISTISKYVFNQGASTFGQWLDSHPDIKMYVNVPDRKAVIKRADVDRLISAVEKARNPEEPAEVKEPVVESTTDDFTPQEKAFISTYLAPISEPKDDNEPVFVDTSPNTKPLSEWLNKENENDISLTHLPKMSHVEFSMEGFDMEFLGMIKERFGDQKIHVEVRVHAEKSFE